MRLRRMLAVLAIVVFGGVPAALAVSADPFGAGGGRRPDLASGDEFINDGRRSPGRTARGTCCWDVFRDASSDDQLAVYERCGSGPVTWQRTVLTDGDRRRDARRACGSRATGPRWRRGASTGGGTIRHYSSVRPPGGAWGAPQLIVSDPKSPSCSSRSATPATRSRPGRTASPAGT